MSMLRAYGALLRNGPLTRLLVGEFISSIGDWLYLVALLIVVYQHSQDALLLGVVGAARVLPYVLLSVPAGIAADRFDRRAILIATDSARAVIMLGIAYLVATSGPIEGIVGLAILATCFSTFFGPTIGAYLPGLVRDERELGPANPAWASLDNLAFVVGPVLAGVLVAVGGVTVAFILNAVSFLIVDLVLWRLPASRGSASSHAEPRAAGPADAALPAGPAANEAPSAAAVQPSTSVRAPIRVLVGLGAMDVVGSFVFGGVGVLTVYLATTTYASGDAATGYLNGAIGIGGLVGALLSGAVVLRPNLGPLLVIGAIGTGTGLVALGASATLVPALVALTIASAGSLVLEVLSTTIFQRAVPDRIRGRALGVMATASSLAFAAGSFLLPVLADGIGVEPVLIVAGFAVTAGALAGRAMLGPFATRPAGTHEATLARMLGLPIFVGVSAARLETAIARIVPRTMAVAEVIIREGDPADRFYVIESGRVRVTQNDHRPDETVLREMGADEVFGEIGLLRASPRTATVTAVEPGLLLVLDRDAFLDLVSADVRLGSRLLDLHRGPTTAEAHAEANEMSAT